MSGATERDGGRSRRWKAKWIWDRGDGCEPNVYCLFRREFTLNGAPGGLRLYITADTRYQFFINGRFVGRGAPQSQPFFQYYDTHDLDGLVRPGANCIGAIVYHLGTLPDTRGGLLAELVDGEGAVVVSSDADWRVAQGEAWARGTFRFRMNVATPFQEVYDARKAPRGWTEAGFDDSRWAAATVLRGRVSDRPPAVDPWTVLVPRDIPFMDERSVAPSRVERVEECLWVANRMRPEDLSIEMSAPGQPLRYARVEGAEALCSGGVAEVQCSTQHEDGVFDGIYDPCLLLDFGRVVPAYARLELEGIEGAAVDVGYAERLIDGYFNNAIEGQFADRYVMVDGPQTWQSFTWKSFRYLKLRFRYCSRPVRLRSARAIVTTYPYEERGAFDSTDETLNRVFDISRYTLRLCSNEFLMDTPWREQAQWLGDVAAVTVPGIYACFGDARLPGKFFRQAARNAHPTGLISNVSNTVNHAWRGAIPDYSLWWVMGLWGHYLYTGEERWIHELYPQALRVLQAHEQYVNEHGLIQDMPYWLFIDWAHVDRRGECAAYNALYYGAMGAMERIAAAKGDAWTVDAMREGQRRLHESFQQRLFDEGRGCFADARVDDALSPMVSEHANLAAIRFGLSDDAAARSIIRSFYEQKTIRYTEAQPFFTIVVLQALQRAGRMDLALELIRERWGRRMVDRGASSVYEEWYQNGSWRSGRFAGFLRTHSHAWSACPAEFLIRNVAGLEILEPGCAKVRLRPTATPFDYRLVYPTPRGEIRVECIKGRCTVSVPEGVTVE